ncbi:MAG: alpha/beta hydrolase [Erythrobacter sp.]|nr:alpha/beta hydrolase [Erythrobacter sp.]
MFGTSEGAVLGAQLVAKLTQTGERLPAALGFFAGSADMTRMGDSEGWLPVSTGPLARETEFGVPLDDPVLSPIFSDLSRFPPTLLITSTRDFALSATSKFGRVLLDHGVDARLVVFDGLPHAFWAYMPGIPETDAANALIASFLKQKVSPVK